MRERSTSLLALIQGIIARSFSPTTSIGCSAIIRRRDSKVGAPARFSRMNCLAYSPVWIRSSARFIAARELLISLYRTFVAAKGVSVPATQLAKYKTLTQQLSVGFAILPLTSDDGEWLWNGLLWLSVVLTLVSGAQYLWRAHAARRSRATVSVG